MAIAALVVGITSLVFSFIPYVNILGVIGGVVGIILGVLGRKNSPQVGMATAGLVCAIVAVALGTILFFACTVTLCTEIGAVNTYGGFYY